MAAPFQGRDGKPPLSMLHIYQEITKTSPGKRGWELPQCFILWSTCPKYSPVHFRKSHFFSRRISTGSCTSCHCCPSLAPETQPQFHSKNSHAQALPAHQAHGVVQRAGTPQNSVLCTLLSDLQLGQRPGQPAQAANKTHHSLPKKKQIPHQSCSKLRQSARRKLFKEI